VSDGEGVCFKQIDGESFEPARVYRVATYQFLLDGLGEIQPLSGYVKEHNLCPPLENCLPIKHYIIETSMYAAWRDIIAKSCASSGHDNEQGNGKVHIKECIQKLFEDMDKNKDGFIEPEELAEFACSRGMDCSGQLVKFLIDTLDTTGDGKIQLDEILMLAR